MIQLPSLLALPWLRHAFSTRAGGVSTVYGNALNLGYTPHDDPANVLENRRRIVESLTATATPLYAARQVHGTAVHIIHSGEPPPTREFAPLADALATAVPGVLLGIQAADCVPILLADTRLRIVAAVHAGWRGTAASILQATVDQLRQHFNSNPADLHAAIGPAIGACCYTVGDEVRERFHTAFAYAPALFVQQPAGLHLNLAEANRRQLVAAGLTPSAIEVIAECTACSRRDGQRKYFSHRAESGMTGRAMGIIGIAASLTA